MDAVKDPDGREIVESLVIQPPEHVFVRLQIGAATVPFCPCQPAEPVENEHVRESRNPVIIVLGRSLVKFGQNSW
jgi:hypothetical protein